ncbi:DNA-directed RNA polymerase subunit alpha [Candidatus Proelusimicrobium excrementi]|uniref:DNA-directed RNA polymerase subunit alpha n=1 Tax=Candidatus Proelusimicrobium excrementi TaxID=3416222 RepID=UPI003C815602|nr:DNA-directed RNA polymerase subunit alpha [Elusimicrobiaceae bacterium]
MAFENLVLPKEIKAEQESATYGKFIAEPYESGLGHTVGNSLRRILLSGLEGAAVTAVKVEGTTHEYSTIPNVREDVIQILLNLKKLRVKMEGSQKEYLTLEADKPGVVTAASIKEVDGVEIINKDLEIVTLEAGGAIRMEIEISRGKGYGEEDVKATRPVGFMPIDSIFSPILKVHYDVEPARVGQKTDYDRLILEITTDGTLEPRRALHKAAVRLSQSLHIFTIEGEEIPAVEEAEPVEAAAPAAGNDKLDEILDQPVDLIELSSRSLNCLKSEDIKTVRDLVAKTEGQLKMVKNFGARSLDEVKAKLADMNLHLGMKF